MNYQNFRQNLIDRIALELGADYSLTIDMNKALTRDLIIAARCLGLV